MSLIKNEVPKMEKPNCYRCRHHRKIIGDVRLQCINPKIGKESFGVKGNPQAIKYDWFRWPSNFDPVWLMQCNGFEPIYKGVLNAQ